MNSRMPYKTNYSDQLLHASVIESNIKRDQRWKEDSSPTRPIRPLNWWGNWSRKKRPIQVPQIWQSIYTGEGHTSSYTVPSLGAITCCSILRTVVLRVWAPTCSISLTRELVRSATSLGFHPRPTESEALKWAPQSWSYQALQVIDLPKISLSIP